MAGAPPAPLPSPPPARPPLQAPFETRLPWCLDAGQWEVAGGVSYQKGAHPPFPTDDSDPERDAWHASLVDVAYGVGRGAEVRVQWGVQGFDPEEGDSTWGIEDVRLSFAHQISFRKVAAAIGFAVKLPNASDEDRLGTDETDVFLTGSAGGRGERWGWAAEAGLGILGHPRTDATQDDVLVFGAAGWRRFGGDRSAAGPDPSGEGAWLATFELSGQAGSRFGNDVQRLSAGVTLPSVRFPLSLIASRGLTSESEEWGIAARVTFVRPEQPPRADNPVAGARLRRTIVAGAARGARPAGGDDGAVEAGKARAVRGMDAAALDPSGGGRASGLGGSRSDP
jgi:hypothetical protein